jgi:hypothetical protein
MPRLALADTVVRVRHLSYLLDYTYCLPMFVDKEYSDRQRRSMRMSRRN